MFAKRLSNATVSDLIAELGRRGYDTALMPVAGVDQPMVLGGEWGSCVGLDREANPQSPGTNQHTEVGSGE